MSDAPPLNIARKLAIGVGDLGLNLYWQFASFFLLFYYTDVLGLSPAVAGAIYMAALIVDGVLDPVVGLIADRTQTKWGRYRPYMMFGAVPLALAFCLNLAAPANGGMGVLVFVAVTHIIFRAAYAMVSIPYASLFARVTRDSVARGDLAGIRMFFATSGAVAVAFLTLEIVKLTAANIPGANPWVLVGAMYGMLASGAIALAVWGSAKSDLPGPAPAHETTKGFRWQGVLQNRAFLVLLVALIVTSICNTMFGKNMLYYFKYILHHEDMIGVAIGSGAIALALFVPVWTLAMRKIGKKMTWVWGAVVNITGFLLWRLVEPLGPEPHILAILVQSAGGAGIVTATWGMLPDTVEYGEWRTGARAESLTFGLTVFGQKAALGGAAGALGWMLTQIGYVANAEQTPDTLDAIKNITFWFPFIGFSLALGVMAFYPISTAFHRKMVEDIDARAAAQPAAE